MRSTLRRSIIASLATILALAIGATSSYAAPPPYSVEPMRCIAEFNENDNYVGEGWVAARVAESNGVFLGCGDERSGVIHIAHPESTGNVHPVYPETQYEFVQCFKAVAALGYQKPDKNFPNTRTRYEYTYYVDSPAGPLPHTATLIKDNAGGFVWTMFTSSPNDADWVGCTAGPEAIVPTSPTS